MKTRTIELQIPERLPHGRRSSYRKGVIEVLIEKATKGSKLEHTPEGHEDAREAGRRLGKILEQEIAKIVD